MQKSISQSVTNVLTTKTSEQQKNSKAIDNGKKICYHHGINIYYFKENKVTFN